MRTTKALCLSLFMTGWPVPDPFRWVERSQGAQGGTVAIDNNDIGGVVTSTKGGSRCVGDCGNERPADEFSKTVVRRSRTLSHSGPSNATYSVWVRGYGLIDSGRFRRLGQIWT
jgi:hypothetical protein